MEDFLHVSFIGGLIAVGGGILAEINNGAGDQTGLWLGASGIVASVLAALGAIAKSFWDDRAEQRKADIMKLRITLGNDRSRRYSVETRQYLEALAEYIARIPGAPPGIPEPPDPGGHDSHAVRIEHDDD